MNELAAFCSSCGLPLNSGHQRCSACGVANHPGCLHAGLCQVCAKRALPDLPPAPPAAFACPRCGAAQGDSDEVQSCACGQRFVLHKGRAANPKLQLPAHAHRIGKISVKWSKGFLYRSGTIDARGVSVGKLDPVAGAVAMDSDLIPYNEIYSIAIWKKHRVGLILFLTLFMIPLNLAVVASCFADGAGLSSIITAVIFSIFSGFGVYKAALKASWMRIYGRNKEFLLRFDNPPTARKPFHDGILRRAGLPISKIP